MSAIPSWARVGAKVVCVDDHAALNASGYRIRPLRAGAVYEVAWVGILTSVYNGQRQTAPSVRLLGVPSAADGWHIARFRPLISQADDITAHFEQFLHTPQKIEERA